MPILKFIGDLATQLMVGARARDHFGIACKINDYLTKAMQYIVAGDEGAGRNA